MTFEEIKKIFFNYDGSLFAMAREEKEAYEQIKLLNISEKTFESWRQELFLQLWNELKENGKSDLFNRMYNLADYSHNKENLLILAEALHYINYINQNVNALISETVLGRKELKERSGLIFWAYDLGEEEIARKLLNFVKDLLKVEASDNRIKLRLERDLKKCNLISEKINYFDFHI